MAARVYGYTSARRVVDPSAAGAGAEEDVAAAAAAAAKNHTLCVITELCEDGNLEDFM